MRNIRTKTGLVALALLALLVLYPFVEAYWMFWRPPQGGQRATVQGNGLSVYAVTFSADGQLLAVAGNDPTIRLLDTSTWKVRATIEGNEPSIYSLAFAPDGRTLASGGDDGTIRLWDVMLARESAALKGHARHATAVCFSPDGTRLASAGSGLRDVGEVTVWDLGTRQAISSVRVDSVWRLAIAFSPDGKNLAIGGSWDRNTKLWDPSTGEAKTLPGRTDSIDAIAFAPDGKVLAAADGAIRLWDLNTREKRKGVRLRFPEMQAG